MSVPRWSVPPILSALCLALVLALCGPHDAQQKNAQDSRQLADDFAVMQPLAFPAPAQSIFTQGKTAGTTPF